MTCLLAIFHVSLPVCDPFSLRRRFVFSPWDAQQRLRSCHCHANGRLPWPCWDAIGPSRHRLAQIEAYSACHRLTDLRELTGIVFLTRNGTPQPGRSWSRRREAFLPLARSYRRKGKPRASLHCHGRPLKQFREYCDGAAAKRGQRAELNLVSRPIRCNPGEGSPSRRSQASNPEWQIEEDPGFWLQAAMP